MTVSCKRITWSLRSDFPRAGKASVCYDFVTDDRRDTISSSKLLSKPRKVLIVLVFYIGLAGDETVICRLDTLLTLFLPAPGVQLLATLDKQLCHSNY